MTALGDALVELGAATNEVIGELENLASQIEEQEDTAAAAATIRETAQRLRDAQPDAPAPDPGPGDPGDGGEGDLPPV